MAASGRRDDSDPTSATTMPEAFGDERRGRCRALLLIGRENRPGAPESSFRRDVRLGGGVTGSRRRPGALPAKSHNARAAAHASTSSSGMAACTGTRYSARSIDWENWHGVVSS